MSRELRTTPRTRRSSRRSVTCASRWRHSPNWFDIRNTSSRGPPVAWTVSSRARSSGWTNSVKPWPRRSASSRPTSVGDRRAGVAAPAAAEDEHEIGRRGDEAAEVRGLAAGRRDERPAEQQGDEEAGDAQGDLEPHEVGDVLVGAQGDGAGGVERDVLGERGDDAEPGDRIGGLDVLAGGQRARTSSGRPCRTAFPVAMRSVTSRCSCFSCRRASGSVSRGERGLVVVAVDRGRLRRRRGGRVRSASAVAAVYAGSAVSALTRFSSTSMTYRSASVRCRAATWTTAARFFDRPVARVESTTLAAERSANSTRIATTVRRPRDRQRPERRVAADHGFTTTSVSMPPR